MNKDRMHEDFDSRSSSGSFDNCNDNAPDTQMEHHFKVILKTLPTKIVDEAENLLHMMANSKDILSWDINGQLKFHQRTIRNSQLSDLLEYILLPEETDIQPPIGLSTFTKGLAELGVDKSMIKNHTVLGNVIALEHQHKEQDISDNDDDDDDDDDDESNSSESGEEGDMMQHDESNTNVDEEFDGETDEEFGDTGSINMNDGSQTNCPDCNNRDVQETDLRKCPYCQWTDEHSLKSSETLSCNACGSQALETSFPLSHTVHHCNNCHRTDVFEHDDEEQE